MALAFYILIAWKIEAKINSDSHIKSSFDPISNADTTILILGSLPGDKSLELQEYYGHPRNKFWKIIAHITGAPLPLIYTEKKELLLKSRIGLWDVAHTASRKGSLDTAILNEMANSLDEFIAAHKNLKVIGFNGMKAEKLFDKYFKRQPGIRYVLLPSSSPANAGTSLEKACEVWSALFH